jgi:hypothetical protein
MEYASGQTKLAHYALPLCSRSKEENTNTKETAKYWDMVTLNAPTKRALPLQALPKSTDLL